MSMNLIFKRTKFKNHKKFTKFSFTKIIIKMKKPLENEVNLLKAF